MTIAGYLCCVEVHPHSLCDLLVLLDLHNCPVVLLLILFVSSSDTNSLKSNCGVSDELCDTGSVPQKLHGRESMICGAFLRAN